MPSTHSIIDLAKQIGKIWIKLEKDLEEFKKKVEECAKNNRDQIIHERWKKRNVIERKQLKAIAQALLRELEK